MRQRIIRMIILRICTFIPATTLLSITFILLCICITTLLQLLTPRANLGTRLHSIAKISAKTTWKHVWVISYTHILSTPLSILRLVQYNPALCSPMKNNVNRHDMLLTIIYLVLPARRRRGANYSSQSQHSNNDQASKYSTHTVSITTLRCFHNNLSHCTCQSFLFNKW